MKKDWKNARERNEANDAAIYARKGIELSRTIISEDTSEYIICAFYPDTGETEILGVGTQAFGLKLGIKMDRDVNIIFL